MLRAKDSLTLTLRKTLLIQVVLTGIAAGIALLMQPVAFAFALLYGGLVASVGTGLHAWRLLKITPAGDDNEHSASQASQLSQANAGIEVFKGALLKYAAIIGLFAIGMGYLKLDALAVLIGFSIAYTGFVFSGGYAPRSRPKK